MLGQTILRNDGSEEANVNAIIGYEFDVDRNFGNHDGIARSVATTAFVPKNEQVEFFWGIQKNDHEVSSKGVGTRLFPGTALNVTLWGNYTTSEGPYRANLVTYWSDGTKSKKKLVQVSNVSKKVVHILTDFDSLNVKILKNVLDRSIICIFNLNMQILINLFTIIIKSEKCRSISNFELCSRSQLRIQFFFFQILLLILMHLSLINFAGTRSEYGRPAGNRVQSNLLSQ